MSFKLIFHIAFAFISIIIVDAGDHEFLTELEDTISEEKLTLNSMPRSRTKRAITINLTPTEITEIVDSHNTLRRSENAADMEIMTWNTVLAEMAQEWAEVCQFGHGYPSHPDAPPDNPGQNVWGGSGAPVITQVVQAWYDEIQYYDYATHGCTATCGHYTQVVWAKTNEVGCGYAQCGSSPQHIVVCNYYPGGNYVGVRPYLEGYPCTQCASGEQWCNDGLCAAGCSAVGPGCECDGLCQNCGTLDSATCTCSCVDGWRSPDCTVECVDTSGNCGNGWYLAWCDDAHPYVLKGCPAYCGLCVNDPNRRLDCPVQTPGPVCTDWSAWNISGCAECGGCGTRVQTRTCGSVVETNRINCEATYCIIGEHEPLESWLYWSRRWGRLVTKYRIRKCCYDFRRTPPKLHWREKKCASRGIRGWRHA